MNHEVRISDKTSLNHDVLRLRLERPAGYEFLAGQAIELSFDQPVSRGPAPFTFTGLTTQPYLELIIKIYRQRNGLTAALERLNPGDTVRITDPWDSYTNNGPGVFLAGGAGITPFVALLRQMQADNRVGESWLFFSNKTSGDVFLHDELKDMLGDRYVDVITDEGNGNQSRYLNAGLLSKYRLDPAQPFYVCGPPGFVDAIQNTLGELGVSHQMVHVSL